MTAAPLPPRGAPGAADDPAFAADAASARGAPGRAAEQDAPAHSTAQSPGQSPVQHAPPPGAAPEPAADPGPRRPRLDDLLARMEALRASDLHLSAGAPPVFRVHGRLQRAPGPPLEPDWMAAEIDRLSTAFDRDAYAAALSADFGISRDGRRYRVNLFRHQGGDGLVIRAMGAGASSLDSLGLPPAAAGLAAYPSGLVLVCGATGSGKTTTLAALIDMINASRPVHILTVEDPVEVVHEDRQGIVRQRELGPHATDFASAVRAALREDPDVILVGEMRDEETMRAALTAAETGHLVFSTLHTGDAAGAVRRLVGAFPAAEQEAVRLRLSQSLRAVLAQHLLPTADGLGRAPAVEVMICTRAIGHMIRAGKLEQLYSAIESGRAEGMQTLEQSLAALLEAGWIDAAAARAHARDQEALERLCSRLGAPLPPQETR